MHILKPVPVILDKHGEITHDGHLLRLEILQYTEDIALRIILL